MYVLPRAGRPTMASTTGDASLRWAMSGLHRAGAHLGEQVLDALHELRRVAHHALGEEVLVEEQLGPLGDLRRRGIAHRDGGEDLHKEKQQVQLEDALRLGGGLV